MTTTQLIVLILLLVIAFLAWAFVRVNGYPPKDPSQRAEEDEGPCGINGSVNTSNFQRGYSYARGELSKSTSNRERLEVEADNPFERDDFERGMGAALREDSRTQSGPLTDIHGPVVGEP